MRPIRYIILHGADTPSGSTRYTAADVHRWHTDPPPQGNGWSDTGYHYIIETDGSIATCRPIDKPGSHCPGYNKTSIGICLMGRGRYTPEQWVALIDLCGSLMTEYGIPPSNIFGHYQKDTRNKPPKTCPSFDVPRWLAANMVPSPENIYMEKNPNG